MRTTQGLPRRQTVIAALAAGFAGHRALGADAADPWPSLAGQIFNNRSIADGTTVLSIEAPFRAEDAAVVPITIQSLLPADGTQRIKSITLVIDENPSPLAAKFALGADSGMRTVSTNVRVDSYTNIHAVAELADNRLLAVTRYVKAAGGCSAPAAKQEASAIPLGTMRFRQFPAAAGAGRREAQLMVRHPNNSGMQMDQMTRLYVPAHFISSITIWQGDDVLLAIEGGISIAENPEFRFDYRPNGATEFRAEAQDNRGETFEQSWSVTRA
jgi:sulfur-oxidizing protein SoxY